MVKKYLKKQKWIISYDNNIEIRKMYKEYSFLTYQLNYSAGTTESGSEVMFFSKNLDIPEKSKNMKNLRKYLK